MTDRPAKAKISDMLRLRARWAKCGVIVGGDLDVELR